MSYLVAAQSALFFIVSCAPCSQVRHRRKARQKAKREREEKARIVMEQPHLYQHPEPYHTNPFWAEEIRLGPSLPRKGKGGASSSKNTSQRRLTTASRDGGASVGNGSSIMVSMSPTSPISDPRTSTAAETITHALVVGPPLVAPAGGEVVGPTLSKTTTASTADGWNLKRYQREDEELWGSDISRTGHKLMDAIKQAGTSAGRFVEAKLGIDKQVTEEDRRNFYFTPKNPPVNDYHPPVVSSRPAHKDALQWMLQPPPPAKVMEGKVPVSRSASVMSGASRGTMGTMDSMFLGRMMSDRTLDARARSRRMSYEGELLSSTSLSRARSRPTTASQTRSRPTVRGNSFSTESEDDSEEGVTFGRRRRSVRRTVATPEAESDGDDENEKPYVTRSSRSLSNSSLPSHAAQKPRLPTILSSDAAQAHERLAAVTRRSRSGSAPSPLHEVTNVLAVSGDGSVKFEAGEMLHADIAVPAPVLKT